MNNIDNYSNEASETPIEDESSPNFPFIRKTPQECHQLLLKLLKDTELEIMTKYFAIMDKKSTQDDTVLLVCTEGDLKNEVLGWLTVCATFPASPSAVSLMCYHSRHSSVVEDLECAQHGTDNVFPG